MKFIHFFAMLILSLGFTACYKPGTIEVKNSISNAKIKQLKWGNVYLGTNLLPGQSTGEITIEKEDQNLPASNKIKFTMEANNRQVYLETEELFSLDQDELKTIVLTDSTVVVTP
ncbi:MAG: hypothetical protein L6Q78_14960 [Bacteroidia bacterium]|nr:hypothetical protein [Bacteroidia bacterium]